MRVGRLRAVTMSSFPATACAAAEAPASAHSGRKEFIDVLDCGTAYQVDVVLSADTVAP